MITNFKYEVENERIVKIIFESDVFDGNMVHGYIGHINLDGADEYSLAEYGKKLELEIEYAESHGWKALNEYTLFCDRTKTMPRFGHFYYSNDLYYNEK